MESRPVRPAYRSPADLVFKIVKLPLQGALHSVPFTQGVALGWYKLAFQAVNCMPVFYAGFVR
jgi:hypothetical protein